MTFLYFILFALVGAFFYRLRGAPGLELLKPPIYLYYDLTGKLEPDWLIRKWPDFLKRPSKQLFFCSGPTIVLYLLTKDLLWSSIAGVAFTAVTCAGHGAYMDLGHAKNPPADQLDENAVKRILEGIQKLLKTSWGKNSLIYDATGLTINGVMMTLPLALVFLFHGFYVAALLAILAGFLKTAAYAIGWYVHIPMIGATEVGEWLTGFFQWGIFGAIYWAFIP